MRKFLLVSSLNFLIALVALDAGERMAVQWRSWGAETFAEAQRRDHPIYLFITAHWSSRAAQMEAEVLSNKDIAQVLNTFFVPIKVDREQRPDIDRRYQEALQATQGSSGWPLNGFLTPEGLWIDGGTYMDYGNNYVLERRGLKGILDELIVAWAERREDLKKQSGELEAELLKRSSRNYTVSDPPATILNDLALRFQQALDPLGGNFGSNSGAKFPAPQALELALVHYGRTGSTASLNVAVHTLDEMLRGGIYDRLEGGFHRFTLDRRWRQPRFEKLLSVNAEMLRILTLSWQATEGRRPEYEAAIRKTIRWLLSQMSDRERGGFFASQAAGSEPGDPGYYYMWTVKEVEKLLPDDRWSALIKRWYEIGDLGEFPSEAPYHNVLYEVRSLEEALQGLAIEPEEALREIPKIHELLYTARTRRRKPPIDTHILVDLNARMVSALLLAGQTFNESDWIAFALKTLDRLLEEGIDAQEGARHIISTAQETPAIFGLAQDEIYLGWAAQDAFLLSGNDKYLSCARGCIERLQRNYLDPDDRTILDRNAQHADRFGRLKDPHKLFQDIQGPSPNAAGALLLLRQATLLQDRALFETAAQLLRTFGDLMEPLGSLGAGLTIAQDAMQAGIPEVWIGGTRGHVPFDELWGLATRTFVPHLLLRYIPSEDSLLRQRGFIGIAEPSVYLWMRQHYLGQHADSRRVKALLLTIGHPQ